MRNWSANFEFSTDDVRRPGSVEELQKLVAAAERIRAFGSRHSFSRVADSTGVLVTTQGLRLETEVDPARGVAVVPGAATYAEVATALDHHGWALHNMGSLPHISVAGACATGTHGSGITNGCLATAVEAVELVRADGELVTITKDDDDFQGAVISLGSLGVVTRLTLKVEPSYQVAQDVLLDVPAENITAELLGSAYSVSLFPTFARPDVVDSVWRKHRTDRGPAPEETWGGQPADRAVHPIVAVDPSAATEQLGRPGPWHERLPHFRPAFTPSVGDELQSEFLLPFDALGEVWPRLCEASPRFTDPLMVVEIRTVAADEQWLSPYHGRDTLAVHATWIGDWARVEPALEVLQEVVAPYDPRPHWGKVFTGWDADRLAAAYPELPRFRELAERMDPERKLVNDYVTGLGVR